MGEAENPADSSRLEHVAEAGMGADDASHPASTNIDVEKGEDRADTTTPESSEATTVEKQNGPPEPPRRGKAKVGLIMASLMVCFGSA